MPTSQDSPRSSPRAVAEGFTQIERVLGTYTVEVPAVIPEWLQEEVDLP